MKIEYELGTVFLQPSEEYDVLRDLSKELEESLMLAELRRPETANTPSRRLTLTLGFSE